MKRKILRKTRIVTILSALVVFLTVYSLVLPAITLTDDAATEDPGINTSETTNVAEVEKLSLNEETSSDVEIETTEQAEEDVQKEIELLAGMYQMEADKLKDMIGEEEMKGIELDAAVNKAADFVVENAVEV